MRCIESPLDQLENEIRYQYISLETKYIQTQSGMRYQMRCIDSPFDQSQNGIRYQHISSYNNWSHILLTPE